MESTYKEKYPLQRILNISMTGTVRTFAHTMPRAGNTKVRILSFILKNNSKNLIL